ncbi:hypothetical protein M427DRAFT_81239, partial [Gonapodya prolifera JEL478]
VPEANLNHFRDWKGGYSWTVLGVCGFDALFHWVQTGWEGSAHDGTVYKDALQTGFNVTAGKYYLGDAGFGLDKYVLVPYRGVRYHLKEWARGQR